ncbi:ABC transporter substrate-binding protein [Aquibacillus albus]|uniref:Raffinose/stachyose/melibiose transport system substrate-binding protein n=1 Tax=Aquibacillus albus TaxID=1168171 RepID=A0ABS2MW15_9BACI|nr:ABC transporter substrate-binding protein [Aquibacillus albus]MBM7570077.1 raffinose/stachyose/melibiose transport system substrate-binding protein [Aquibacillus albus]
MKYLRKNWLFGLMVLFLFLLAACSSGDSGSETTSTGGSDNSSDSENENEERTVTIQVGNSETAQLQFEALAADIKEKYNITTKFDWVPTGGEGDNLVKTRLAVGEMADLLVYNSGSLFKALNPSEYFVDLSEEPFMERVVDTFQEATSDESGTYGVPVGTSLAGAIIYNKAVYEELGLKVPHTWEEFIANNEVVKEAGEIIPVIAPYQDTYTSQIIFLADYYNVHSENPEFAELYTTNQAKIADTPIVRRGFEKTAELYEKGFYNDEASSTPYTKGAEMIANGEAAHFPMLTSILPYIQDNFSDSIDDIGVFGVPGDDPENHGITLWLPSGLYINKDAEDIEAAKIWAEYMVSDEGVQTLMSVAEPVGPPVVEGIELPEDSFEAVKETMTYIDSGNVASALEFYSPLKGPNLEHILIEVGLGMISAQEGAEKYDKDVEKQAQQLDLEGW